MKYKAIRAEGVRTLKALGQYAGPTQAADIAERLELTTQAVRKVLQRCAAAGFVDATMGEKAGAWMFQITEAGRQRIKEGEVKATRHTLFNVTDSAAIVQQAMKS